MFTNEVMQAADLVVFDGKILKSRYTESGTPVDIPDGAYALLDSSRVHPLRSMTVTQAQAQSLALKTLGFTGEYEVRLEHDPETGDIEFDIYHVRVRIDPYGAWEAFTKEGGESLSSGQAPDFRDHRVVNR